MKKAGKSNKIICLRMKPITTQLRLKLSVGQLPASAEPFAPPCQGAHLCTKLCGFQVRAILQNLSLRHVLVNCLNRLFRKRQPMVILLGGKTGRDGIGGSTGSSKVQTVESVEKAGAEVQKGNAIEERKLQRLFRNPEVTRLIKKSNDFGAGGVCVAIGELADGLEIDLDKVPLKYQGLNGTEIAISESQE